MHQSLQGDQRPPEMTTVKQGLAPKIALQMLVSFTPPDVGSSSVPGLLLRWTPPCEWEITSRIPQKYCSFADIDEDAEHVPRRATSNQSSGDKERQSFNSPEAADKTADKAGSASPNNEEQEDSASEQQVAPPKRQRIESDSDSE